MLQLANTERDFSRAITCFGIKINTRFSALFSGHFPLAFSDYAAWLGLFVCSLSGVPFHKSPAHSRERLKSGSGKFLFFLLQFTIVDLFFSSSSHLARKTNGPGKVMRRPSLDKAGGLRQASTQKKYFPSWIIKTILLGKLPQSSKAFSTKLNGFLPLYLQRSWLSGGWLGSLMKIPCPLPARSGKPQTWSEHLRGQQTELKRTFHEIRTNESLLWDF